MRRALPIDEFARLTHLGREDVERYRDAGLLDPDGDGLFDEYDILRLRFLRMAAPGLTVEEIAQQWKQLDPDNPWSDILYGARSRGLTLEDAADAVGLTPEQVRALLVAVGVSESFVEVEPLRTIKALADTGLPWEAILEGGRVLGDSVRRIADTEVRLFHTHVHDRLLREGQPDEEVVRMVREASEAALPLMDEILRMLHRSHLLRASVEDALMHLEQTDPRAPGVMEASILFVDLALFTSLAQTHGDDVAVNVVSRFDSLVRGTALEHDGFIVKQIGDEFMLAFPAAMDAARFAVALHEAAASQDGFPALRLAVNHGPVIFRFGDYFGNTVNVASRIASMAAPGESLLTEQVARAAEQASIPVEPVGVRVVRGVSEPLTLWRIAHGRARRLQDPVCGMMVADPPAGRFTHEEVEFWFCSADCLKKFLENPPQYADARAQPPSV